MRRILALFDAPAPALVGLAALATAGVDPADVACVPAPPGAADLARAPLATADDLPALRRALGAADLPGELLEAAVEMVRRGGILTVVETPNRSAALVAQLLDSAGALDPVTLIATWQAHPGTTYDWARVPPPLLDAPAPPEGLLATQPSPPAAPNPEPPAESSSAPAEDLAAPPL